MPIEDAGVDRPRCAYYGDIVGVYEPARLLLSEGTELGGSPLTLGDELHTPGAIVVHERCYEDFEREHRHGRAGSAG